MAKILLIEPNRVLARICVQGLTRAGHKVCHVVSAQEAIYAADDCTPDVVVLEPQLAGQDGIAFLHEFRSYTEWQAVPVILYTHLPPSKLAAALPALQRDLGVSTSLYKPRTTLEQFLLVVAEITAA